MEYQNLGQTTEKIIDALGKAKEAIMLLTHDYVEQAKKVEDTAKQLKERNGQG